MQFGLIEALEKVLREPSDRLTAALEKIIDNLERTNELLAVQHAEQKRTNELLERLVSATPKKTPTPRSKP